MRPMSSLLKPGLPQEKRAAPKLQMQIVATPGKHSIDQVSQFLNTRSQSMPKDLAGSRVAL